MTTPNVEELITYLQGLANEIEIPYPMEVIEEAAEVLQSQAERIAELERESETHSKAYGLAIVERDNLRHELKTAQEGWRCECSTDDACRFARERDALRAELATIAAADPVAWMVQFSPGSRWVELTKEEFDSDLDGHIVYKKQAFFTRPMPAQRLTELKLLMLTTAYEQGVGKGIQRRDCNPYAADTDEHAAWALGYEEGLGLRRI